MKEEHFEYLEAYLEGMLSPEEREDVWRQIRRDPQLAEELIIRSTDQAQMGLWAARNAPDLLAIDKIHKDNEDSFKAHPANSTTGNPSLYRTPSPSEKKEGRTPFTFANNCINSIIHNIPRFTKMKPNITHRNFLSNPVFLTGGLVVLLVAGLLFWFADSSEPQEQGDIAYFSRPIEESDEYHKGATIVAFVSGEVSLIEPSRHASNAAAESLGPTKRPAKANDVLPPGCQVHTGANSEVILLFSNGTIATVGANTQMLVEAFVQKEFDGSDKKVGELLEEVSPSRMKLNLDLGELIVDVRKLNRQSSLIIPTSVGTAGIRGTQFMVTANEDAAAVSVLTGLVDFLDVEKAVYHIAKEARLEANKETAPKRLAIPITVKERIEAAIQIARQKTGHLSVADLVKAFGEVSSRGVFI
ncbi:MAG: FecR family protein, partial [Opitutales bacterium]